MPKYIVGIDFGGTKTDFLLTTTDGDFIDFYNVVTNRKLKKTAQAQTLSELGQQMKLLLNRNGLNSRDIQAVGIGYSMMPRSVEDKKKLNIAMQKILGIKNIDFTGDAETGTLVSMSDNFGISVYSGTGCLVVGKGPKKEMILAGGLEDLTGDKASGIYIWRQAMAMMYSHYCLSGKDSLMFPELLELLKYSPKRLRYHYGKDMYNLDSKSEAIIGIVDMAAQAGDELAMGLLDGAGVNLGQSVAYCINHMSLEGRGTEEMPIDISVIGSLWYKLAYDGMRGSLVNTAEELTGKKCRLLMLEEPAAVGCIIVAKKQIGDTADIFFRQKISAATNGKVAEIEMSDFIKSEPTEAEILRFLLITLQNKQDMAINLNIPQKIQEILGKYQLLKGISIKLATAFSPTVTSIIKEDYQKALSLFLSGSLHAQIPQEDIEAYITLAINLAAAAEDEANYIHFSKARLSHLINNGQAHQVQQELEEFLTLLPEDEDLLALKEMAG